MVDEAQRRGHERAPRNRADQPGRVEAEQGIGAGERVVDQRIVGAQPGVRGDQRHQAAPRNRGHHAGSGLQLRRSASEPDGKVNGRERRDDFDRQDEPGPRDLHAGRQNDQYGE
jgi:hypothetical protein